MTATNHCLCISILTLNQPSRSIRRGYAILGNILDRGYVYVAVRGNID